MPKSIIALSKLTAGATRGWRDSCLSLVLGFDLPFDSVRSNCFTDYLGLNSKLVLSLENVSQTPVLLVDRASVVSILLLRFTEEIDYHSLFSFINLKDGLRCEA